MALINKILFSLVFGTLFILGGCSASQESKLIGLWVRTPMDALPEEFPQEYWEFTSDNDILKYQVTDLEQNLLTVGRWGFAKRNKLSITKFDVGFNGEWDVVYFKNDVMRMVLKVFNSENQPAGQVLVEFTRARTNF
jgi:hypothetical protein